MHTAPGHGREDFEIWMDYDGRLQQRGIDTTIPFTVDADGCFTREAPGFEGKRVITEKGDKGDANDAVIKALVEAGALIARGRLKHQYPHSWRSKKPVIFRNTPQWFIAMDRPIGGAGVGQDASDTVPSPLVGEGQGGGDSRTSEVGVPPTPNPSPQGGGESAHDSLEGGAHQDPIEGFTLRQLALRAIAETQWVPPQGQNRITGMIEAKPDWVLSRQRAWGVPIPIFVKDNPDGSYEILKDERVNARIVAAIEKKGISAWHEPGAAERFLGKAHSAKEWKKVDDICDVWFNSASTHAFTLEDPKHFPQLAGIRRKRDGGEDTVMYLEGSDQHRGWFHSSLLESCGTRGRAPYDVVLTHGFILDEKGEEKMSKSRGNVLSPQELMKKSGADILRLWVASSDYTSDIRFGPGILQGTVEAYRKLRNTLRWMLGTLSHYEGRQQIAPAALPELEQLMLHRLAELDEAVRGAYAEYDYRRVVATLSHFMNTDLSAFYFDIRKDALYCEPYSSAKRRAALETIEQIFRHVTLWLAPLLCFTAEEAWLARYPSEDGSVHLAGVPRGVEVLAQRRAGGGVGADQARAPRGDGRPGDRARQQEDRLGPGGGTAGVHRQRAAVVGARRHRLRRDLHHVRHRDRRGRGARGRLHPARRARRRRRAEESHRQALRPLLALHRRRGQRPGLPGPLRPRRRRGARARRAGCGPALTAAARDIIRVLHEQDRQRSTRARSIVGG